MTSEGSFQLRVNEALTPRAANTPSHFTGLLLAVWLCSFVVYRFFSLIKMDNLDWEEHSNRNNSPILPKSIRGLIVGKSGCGKTNLFYKK